MGEFNAQPSSPAHFQLDVGVRLPNVVPVLQMGLSLWDRVLAVAGTRLWSGWAPSSLASNIAWSRSGAADVTVVIIAHKDSGCKSDEGVHNIVRIVV